MKKLGVLLFGLVTLLPAYAQNPPVADPAASAGTAPADAATPAPEAGDAPATPAETAAPDAATAPVAEAPADTGVAPASGDTPPADASASAPADSQSERTPLKLYAGYDYAFVNMHITSPNPPAQSAMQTQFGGDFFTSNFHQVRGGVRLFDVIGLEGHFGFKAEDGNKAGKVSVKNYGGIYIAPTGTVLDTVEVAALIGYSFLTVSRPGAEVKLRGVSYGVNVELPIHVFSDALPNLRLGGGMMMYHRDSESQTYGLHAGLRYDFKI